MTALWIGLAGGAGGASRYLLERALGSRATGRLPWALLLINATGSLILGWLVAAHPGSDALLICGTGWCGGFTTMSSALLDAAARADHSWTGAAGSAAAMLIVSVGAASLGVALGS